MFYFVFGTLVIGFIFWLIEMRERKCTKVDDTPEVDNTELDHVPTKVNIEKHNAQVEQQRIIKKQKAKQHISSILDRAYKDYINEQIKNGSYIGGHFILDVGDYGLTFEEICAICDNPFNHGIYKVEYRYSYNLYESYLIVTVNN